MKSDNSSQSKSARTRSATVEQVRKDIAVTVDKTFAVTVQKRLSDDEEVWALDRITAGDTMLSVTQQLGVGRGALFSRAYDDPNGFGRKLALAMEIGTFARLENAENMIRKGDLTTGEFDRDKEYMRYAQFMAKTLNRRTFGDRQQIEVTQSTYILPKDADEF